jgi:hypothetical protein
MSLERLEKEINYIFTYAKKGTEQARITDLFKDLKTIILYAIRDKESDSYVGYDINRKGLKMGSLSQAVTSETIEGLECLLPIRGVEAEIVSLTITEIKEVE